MTSWINTDDELPKKEELYLAHDHDGTKRLLTYRSAYKKHWKLYVKYWMSIPELPNGK